MGWIFPTIGGLAVLLGLAAAAEALCERRDELRFPPPGQMIDAGGGRRLHLYCTGAGPGPTVVIEQGAGSPSILWWPIQDQVAAFARVCTYDRAGYLWSDPATPVRSLADRVTDLHTVLTRGKVAAPYLLVAHSFGGPLVRLFAAKYPETVAGMVLVDTPEEAVIFGQGYQDYCRKISLFARGLTIAARLGILRLAASFMTDVPPGLTPNAFAALKSMIVKPDFFRAMADDPASLTRDAHPGGFGTLGDKPLAVITHGIPFPGPAALLENGWLEGEHRLAAQSPQSEFIVATKSNHMVPSDEPELVVAAIERVVHQVRAAQPVPTPARRAE